MKKYILTILIYLGTLIFIHATPQDSLYITPNPCDSSTTIHFTISQTDTITLEVYNVLGQIQNTFFLNTILPSGSYAINYQTYQLPYGIYFVRLKINSTTKSLKLLRINSVDIKENSINNSMLLAYPNPTTEKINVLFRGQKQLLLFDISGKIVKTIITEENTIDLSDINNGNYVLKIFNDKRELMVNQKIIKTQ